MIIEETTTYAYKLKYIENVSFNRIRAFAQSFVNELPQELVDDIYEQLNRGLDLLQNEPQMLVYLYSFGNMHQAKLNRAFEQLPDAFLQQPEIRIVDYGCGQAIGTMCYADYLAEHGLSQTVKSITLVEPSEICLKRAALHVSQFFPDAETNTICKTFNNLTDNDLANADDIPTLHILSNVLDIQEFDLKDFATLIDNKLNNYNQFVCVGPYFNYSDKDERMSHFAELLKGNVTYSKIFEKGELCTEKTWTAQIVCFSVGELLTDYKRYKDAAEKGDASAQFNIGVCYEFGQGIEQNYEKAVEWITKSAKQGYARAQCNLGYCYQYGQGVEQDYQKAVEWYTKAAEQGDATAQNNLGYCYAKGLGVVRNTPKAVMWYAKAAEQGDATAQYNLGCCYKNGQGVERNFQKAVEWYTKSAEQGFAEAQNKLGDCYYNGKGVEQDYKKAAEWYAKAAKNENK